MLPYKELAEDNYLNKDQELVTLYQAAAQENGINSSEAYDAFNQIVETYEKFIFCLARKQGLDEETAEDLAQETLTTIWKRLNGKETITNLRGLITHSFQCRWKTYLERTYHKRANGTPIQTFSLDSSLSISDTTTQLTTGAGGKGIALVNINANSTWHLNMAERLYDPNENIEQAVIQAELLRELRELIAQMPKNYRLALLQQLAGAGLREIAESNDWTIDQTKKYIVRARQWLSKHRHLLNEEREAA